MNRLQKKCFFAATGAHLLLGLILLVGPAFLSRSHVDDSQVIDFIPANLIDAAMNGGGGPRNPAPTSVPLTQPAAPQQVTPPPQQAKTELPTPKPVQLPKPAPVPVKDTPKVDPKLSETKPTKPKPAISTTIVTRPKNTADSDAAARAKQLADSKRRADQIAKTAANLHDQLSPKTDVDNNAGFGGGGEAYAGYEMAVRSAYENAWVPPDNTSSDDATAKITVTIASDGTVISSSISQSSGDAQIDASIQRALDHVTFIGPFPKGSKDAQRIYIIPLNLKTKRSAA